MSTTIHFNCQHCGLPYLAKQEATPTQYSGMIECVDCKKLAHGWSGFYNLTDWHPVRMKAPGPMGTPR
jgi:hypothetical protein